MTRAQFQRLTCRDRTCCTICYSEGRHDVVVAGVVAAAGAKHGTPLYWRRLYRSVAQHIAAAHPDHPLTRAILG